MTPDERALRDAFLAELWPVVKEYHQPVEPRPKAVENPVRSRRKRAA